MKLTFNETVFHQVPALDRKGQPIVQKTRWGGREMEVEAMDRVEYIAGNAYVVNDEEFAEEMIEKKLASKYDPILDEEKSDEI